MYYELDEREAEVVYFRAFGKGILRMKGPVLVYPRELWYYIGIEILHGV